MFEVHRQTYCRDGIWCTFLWNPEFHAEARKGGEISFNNAGCLECGSCRVMCKKEGVIEWPYPRGTFGVDFRCG